MSDWKIGDKAIVINPTSTLYGEILEFYKIKKHRYPHQCIAYHFRGDKYNFSVNELNIDNYVMRLTNDSTNQN